MSDLDLAALRILRDALDTGPGERARFVSERCGADAALRQRVETMLRGIDDADEDAAARAEPGDALIGRCLGPFRVIEAIGRGGMGVVYRGEREEADFAQTVAIKLIRRGFDFDDVQARFLRERRILARLNHPNLARLIDGGVAPDGRPWFALEFVEGSTIGRWCDEKKLGVRERVRLFLDVCAAVQYAHSQLVVHRDLKPGNILVGTDGSVRLLDFGIARLLEGDAEGGTTLTMTGSGYALTPEYAAPEQFQGTAVGVAADVYALGVVLYELIAGVGPYTFDRRDLAAAERTVCDTEPEALTQAIARDVPGTPGQAVRLAARDTSVHAFRTAVRGDLSRILGKALAKEPERRYPSVEAFAGDLSRWLDGAPVHVSGNGLGYRLRKFVGRNRVAVGIASVLVLGLVAVSALALRAAWSERIQRQAAVAEAARVTAVRDYIQFMFREAGEHGGSATTAREVLRRGADSILTRFAERPAEGQEIAINLAELYMQIGDVEGAQALLERLIDWPDIEANPDVLARTRYNLAQTEYLRGNAPRARELLDAAQAFWQTQPARYGLTLNESRIAQARIENAEGRSEAAIATLQAAIAERRRQVGYDREVGAAFGTLLTLFTDARRYEDGIVAGEEGLRLAEQAGDDPITLLLLNNLGSLHGMAGHVVEAEANFRQVVALRRERYGRTPELATVLFNLAMLQRIGAPPELVAPADVFAARIPLLEEAHAIALEFVGETGRITVPVRYMLGEAYARAGRVDDAQRLLDDVLPTVQANFGKTHAFVIGAHRARAWLRHAQHRDDEARAELAQAQAIAEQMGKTGEAYLPTLAEVRDALDARTPTGAGD